MPPDSTLPGGGMCFLGATQVTLNNCALYAPDRYVFCTSDTYSREDQSEWQRTQGYDACYCIYFPEAFFGGIPTAVAAEASYVGFLPVTYYDGEIDIASSVAYPPPELLKERENTARRVRCGPSGGR